MPFDFASGKGHRRPEVLSAVQHVRACLASLMAGHSFENYRRE